LVGNQIVVTNIFNRQRLLDLWSRRSSGFIIFIIVIIIIIIVASIIVIVIIIIIVGGQLCRLGIEKILFDDDAASIRWRCEKLRWCSTGVSGGSCDVQSVGWIFVGWVNATGGASRQQQWHEDVSTDCHQQAQHCARYKTICKYS